MWLIVFFFGLRLFVVPGRPTSARGGDLLGCPGRVLRSNHVHPYAWPCDTSLFKCHSGSFHNSAASPQVPALRFATQCILHYVWYPFYQVNKIGSNWFGWHGCMKGGQTHVISTSHPEYTLCTTRYRRGNHCTIKENFDCMTLLTVLPSNTN